MLHYGLLVSISDKVPRRLDTNFKCLNIGYVLTLSRAFIIIIIIIIIINQRFIVRLLLY